MDAGTLGVFIPILALSIPIIAIWTTHQRKLAEMQLDKTATASAEKAAQYATQIQRLEDRVHGPPEELRLLHATQRGLGRVRRMGTRGSRVLRRTDSGNC